MKFFATAALLSLSAVSASPLVKRQAGCTIIKPDGLITFDLSQITPDFDYSTITPGNDFNAVGTTITGAEFTTSGGVANGPCALKFYFSSPNSFTSTGSGQLNVFQINPDLDSPEQILSSAFLLGTVNVRSFDPSEFPKAFEVNSPACPANGKMVVGFAAADGASVSFTQADTEGLFVFKGDCWGPPQF